MEVGAMPWKSSIHFFVRAWFQGTYLLCTEALFVCSDMLPGLLEGQEKMSKSDPSSSIFMEDDEVEVNVKIKNAFYPPKVVENNPCVEYIKHLIFPLHEEFTVERKTFKSFEELIVDYESGEVHAGNLKLALAEALNHILQRVRDHFINDPKAKELLKRVKVELNAKKIEEHLPKSENNVENEENNISENLPSQLLHSLSPVPELQSSLKKRFNTIRSIGEECTYEDELEKLLANKSEIICYDGFEPSGRMHIAEADICQMGMDQHEVNMLAREYCDDIKRKDKPIIVSHHILPGLHEGQKKMSKTDPSSCIFMEDEEVDVNVKIKKAFCPPKVVENNPCLELIKHLIFPSFEEFTVERKPNNGGDKTFKSFEELIVDYESGEMHPGDLKPAIAKALNRILQPVRDHFIKDPKAMELLKRVKSYRVTR